MKTRLATSRDARPLAAVHICCWKETYSGIMPDAFLRSIRSADRATMWKRIILSRREKVFIAQVNRRVVGFAACGPAKEITPSDWEIFALYVLKNSQGRGIGSLLWNRCLGHLARRGCETFHLWSLEKNDSANRFYRHMGGNPCAFKPITIGGEVLAGQAYCFKIGKRH
ncbi:MAG: GNAT family N-acetyltransferase [Elusimicrobia bacterium]|nr:GNAT family N-acetyltransferase [Elusimicrobiota bacterium]